MKQILLRTMSSLAGPLRDSRGASVLIAAALITSCGESASQLAEKAQASYTAQDYAAARIEAASALREDPGNRAMLALMVRSSLQMNDPDGAEGAIARLERAGGEPAELSVMRAEIALLRGHAGKALELVGDVVTVEAWRIRGQAHLALGNDAGAMAAFEKGLAAGGSVRLAEVYARSRLAAGNPEQAARIQSRMAEMAPDDYRTLMLAGDIAAARGQIENAIAAYRRVIEKWPGRSAPMLALANQYDAQGKVDEAMDVVEKAAKLAAGDPAIEAMQVQLWSEKGEWEKIRDALQGREADLEPGSGLSMSYGEAMLALGHAEQARLIFKRATLALPGNPYSRMMLGAAQLETGDAQGAWATLRPLAMSTLARPEVMEIGRQAAQAVGAPQAATLATRLEKDRLAATMAMVNEGQSAIARQDWAGAIPVYARLLERGEDPEVLKRLAVASNGLGRWADAVAFADRALAREPANPDYLYLAGLMRLEGNREQGEARRLIEEASRRDPRNPAIARDLERAKAAAG